MKISDLQPRLKDIELEVEVVEVGSVREFEKFGEKGKVVSITIRDETGEVSMTLWNEQIDLVKVGAKIKIENGFVNEWQGEKQVTTGRKGTITLI